MDDNKELNFDININDSPMIDKVSSKEQDQKANIKASKSNNDENAKVKIDFTNFLSYAEHPIIVFFTLIFKVLSAIIYLFLSKFFGNSLSFVFIVVLNTFDFWYVKNISGRFLVGLRWWNEVNKDGTEEWIYESEKEVRKANIDTRIFWGSLYITPFIWGLFLFFNIFSLSSTWVMVCFISLILSASNMIGYFKCSGEQKKNLTDFIVSKGMAGMNLAMGNSEIK